MPLERRVLIWMCVLVAVNQLGFGAMIPTLPLYAQSFGVAASAIGMAVAVYGLARFLVALPAGRLADGLGRRPTLAIGGIISGIGNIWCAWASSYPEFIIARFVAGAGAGLVITTGQVVLADISSPERRGRTISIYQGTFIFSVGIGPFPGGLLAEYAGLGAPFFAAGIAALLAAIVAWFAVTETREFARDKGGGQVGPAVSFVSQIRELASHTGFLLVSLVSLANAVVRTGGLFTIVPVLVTAKLGLSISAIGFGMMLGSISGLITAYPVGWLSDTYGRKAVIVPASLLIGGSMVLFNFAPSYAWFLVASIVWGIAIQSAGSAPAAYAADTAPPGRNAAAMSTFRMTGDAGYVIGPLLLGLLVDLYGAPTALWIAASLPMLMGLAFGLLAPETHRART